MIQEVQKGRVLRRDEKQEENEKKKNEKNEKEVCMVYGYCVEWVMIKSKTAEGRKREGREGKKRKKTPF